MYANKEVPDKAALGVDSYLALLKLDAVGSIKDSEFDSKDRSSTIRKMTSIINYLSNPGSLMMANSNSKLRNSEISQALEKGQAECELTYLLRTSKRCDPDRVYFDNSLESYLYDNAELLDRIIYKLINGRRLTEKEEMYSKADNNALSDMGVFRLGDSSYLMIMDNYRDSFHLIELSSDESIPINRIMDKKGNVIDITPKNLINVDISPGLISVKSYDLVSSSLDRKQILGKFDIIKSKFLPGWNAASNYRLNVNHYNSKLGDSQIINLSCNIFYYNLTKDRWIAAKLIKFIMFHDNIVSGAEYQ